MSPTDNFDQYPFLQGGGLMGALIRAYDWAVSPLGSPGQWPSSLRTSVSNMLNTGLPMLVLWGPELICLYNDFVIPSLDPDTQHPAIGKPSSKIWPQAWPVVGPLLEGVLQSGEPVTLQDVPMTFYRHQNTEEVFWTFCYSAIRTEEGHIGGILVTCLETTQGVRARQQLEQNQQHLLASFNESPVAIAILSKEKLTFQMVNPFFGALVGRTLNELVNKPLLEALPELAGQGFDQWLRDVIDSGTPYIAHEVAVDLVRNNQRETIYIDLTYQPRREADKHISGILIVAIDVTQQVRARQKIEESEAHLELLSNTVPAMIFYLDQAQRYQSYNETFSQWFNVGPTEILGKTVQEFLGDAVYQKLSPHLAVAYSGQQERYELLAPSTMGTGRWLNITYTPHKAGDGTVLGLIVHAADITQTKQTELALKESEARFRAMVQQAPVAMLVLRGAELVFELVNEAMLTLIGRDAVIIGQSALTSLPELESQPVWGIVNDVYRTGEPYFAQELPVELVKDGQLRQGYYSFSYIPLKEDGQTRGILQVAVDMTTQVTARQAVEESESRYRHLSASLEEQVQQRIQELAAANEKLLAINEDFAVTNQALAAANHDLQRSNDNLQQFAYVASHDLQEPLRKIQSFSSLLSQHLTDRLDETASTYLDRITKAGARMSTLIKDLLNYSRIATRQQLYDPISLNALLATVLDTLSLEIEGRQARIQLAELPVVNGDASQLSQLFQNLLSNALKFTPMDQIPQVHIEYFQRQPGELPSRVRPNRMTPFYHQISVSDQGVGFDIKYLDRIFQVFQRLHGKDEFAGTGVGLAICQRVVENHGGGITAASQPGEGATFCVYLPA